MSVKARAVGKRALEPKLEGGPQSRPGRPCHGCRPQKSRSHSRKKFRVRRSGGLQAAVAPSQGLDRKTSGWRPRLSIFQPRTVTLSDCFLGELPRKSGSPIVRGMRSLWGSNSFKPSHRRHRRHFSPSSEKPSLNSFFGPFLASVHYRTGSGSRSIPFMSIQGKGEDIC